MDRKPNINKEDIDGSYAFDMGNEFNSVVSARECTGLMPTPPQDYDEAEAYNEIYVVPQVENSEEKKLRK